MIIDISRGLMETPPYPGEQPPRLTVERDIKKGAAYHLQRLEMSLHVGTHIDAPLHFIADGADIASVDLPLFMGACLVIPAEALEQLEAAPPRLLLRGVPNLSPRRIEHLLTLGIRLLGVETASVGAAGDEAGPHVALLSTGMALLENLDLGDAPDGPCELVALPLRITGGEASPCRAVLLYP